MDNTGSIKEQNRHSALGLSDQQVLDMYYYMLLARRLDERMWLLNRSGQIHFVISGQGQEGAQVGAAFALDRSKDFLCPYYRDMAAVCVFGMTAREHMLHAFAKAEDPNSGGRQMPQHYGGKKYRILSLSSPVATQVPHAAGLALAGRLEGRNSVALVCFGEGSSNQGDFHEGANFAGVHKLPVIFFCENNKYAISVPLTKQVACERIADRAAGYGFPGVSIDGTDPLAVYRVTKEAVDRARAGEGPTLIEVMTTRFTPHSSDDDDRYYRPREEVEAARQRDPIVLFQQYLQSVGLFDEHTERRIHRRVAEEVDEATEYARQAPDPLPEDALKHVYAE